LPLSALRRSLSLDLEDYPTGSEADDHLVRDRGRDVDNLHGNRDTAVERHGCRMGISGILGFCARRCIAGTDGGASRNGSRNTNSVKSISKKQDQRQDR